MSHSSWEQIKRPTFLVGMGWFQKCVHRKVANAKLYLFCDCVLVYPNQTWTFPLNDIAITVSKCTNIS